MGEVPQSKTEFLLAQLDDQHLSPFRCVRQLCISDCGLSLAGPLSHRVHLTSLLSTLLYLRRLDLSGTDTGGMLGQVLTEIPCPLEYLNLSNSQLEWEDLDGLAQSKHTVSLKELNIAYIHPEPCKLCRGVERVHGGVNGITASDTSEGFSSEDSGEQTPPAKQGSLAGEYDSESGDSWEGQGWDNELDGRATPCEHETLEANFYQKVAKIVKHFPHLVLLDISSTLCHFRMDQETLLILLHNVRSMTQLKQLCMEDVPLWNDEIFDIVEAASDHPSLHSLTMTRSKDAPTLQMTDKFDFWKRMHKAKKGKFIKTAIGNFVDEYLYEMPDSDDETSVFESISSLEL